MKSYKEKAAELNTGAVDSAMTDVQEQYTVNPQLNQPSQLQQPQQSQLQQPQQPQLQQPQQPVQSPTQQVQQQSKPQVNPHQTQQQNPEVQDLLATLKK